MKHKNESNKTLLHGLSCIHIDNCDEEKEKIIAAIYARTSSKMFGYSLDEQIRLCRERCKIMGWEVRYIFKENGKSGGTLDRPKFKIMMERARQNAFHVVIFWKMDRFCRSLVDLVNVERELIKSGVHLHSVTEQIDTVTPFGRFNFRNIGSAAELERDLIKERVKMGMKGLALKHKWINKKPPIGYDKTEDGYLTINKKQARLVKKIYAMYLKLKSMPQVAFELNKKKIKTLQGNQWSTSSIKRILDNEIYIGWYKVAGVEDYIDRYKIIDKNIFEKVKKFNINLSKIRSRLLFRKK